MTTMKLNAQKLKEKALPRSSEEMAMSSFRRENRNWLNASTRIALSIRTVLRHNGISQSEFARRLNVTPAQVTKILGGKENLGLKTIDKIEQALGVAIIEVPELNLAEEYA